VFESAVCIIIYYYQKWDGNGELMTEEEEAKVYQEWKDKFPQP
jgi:hypothetical protein